MHSCNFLFKPYSGRRCIIPVGICYPDPANQYIVYTDASDNACGAQLPQEHDGMEFPIAFLSYTFMDTQWKWSTTQQKAYAVYYAVTEWNYYLQGAGVIICNDHKPLARFLNGKNTKNKVHRWGLELATYNITFEWISRAPNKAVDCLSRQVELPWDGQAKFKCSLPPTMMDMHSTLEVELHNKTSQKISLLKQIQLHQILPTSQTHQMPWQNH